MRHAELTDHRKLLDQIGLPCAPEAERSIIAQVLLDESIFPALSEMVTESDFTSEAHRVVWRAMYNLHAAGKPLGNVSIFTELSDSGTLRYLTGGLSELLEYTRGEASLPRHADHCAEVVAEKAEKRRVLVSLDAAMKALLTGESVDTALKAVSSLYNESGKLSATSGPVLAGEALAAIGIDALIAPAKGQTGSIGLPWASLHELVPVLKPGQLVILAARPSLGKSAAGLQIATHAAANGHGVLMFPLEMEAEENLSRMIAELGQVNMHKFACGWKPSPVEMHAIKQAAYQISELPLWLDSDMNRTAASIARATRAHCRKHPHTRLVILDYLQLAGADSAKANRNEQLEELTRGLKLLAKELHITVIAVSQLSRDVSKDGGRPPDLHDLRSSGGIEQDANIVIFLHNKNGLKDTDSPVTEVDFIVRKNRGGPKGTRTLNFLRSFTKFIDKGGSE